ncbi:hypothetical protein GGX14DRAFT_655855 [Mycena pura]|uniref:Carbohydrate-binding module family 19 domain-containing protein n=1 Tax=Mycena pura TaxID=153505 RepID=A0AAD6Y6E0_9AGAR|nr:hypothetical protein GGX14DRAFT_655855 [Mycena pura]
MFGLTSLALIFSSTLVYAAPVPRANLVADNDTLLNNGLTAQKLNAQFQNLTTDDACTTGDVACIRGALANCVASKWTIQPCPASLSCFAVPSLTGSGVNVNCTSERNALSINQAALNATDDSGEACEPDSGDNEDGADNGNGDDTCDSDGGDDDNGDDTCDGDGGDGESPSASAGTTTVTATATPTASGEKTVTVTVTPDSPATTTVSVAVPTDISILGPFTTTISGGEVSSLISSLLASGASVVTTVSPSASGLAPPDASEPDSSIIQLTPAPSSTASASASASAAAPDQDNAAAPIASAASQPVLTLVPAAPAAATSGSVPLAASASSAANPFGFADY